MRWRMILARKNGLHFAITLPVPMHTHIAPINFEPPTALERLPANPKFVVLSLRTTENALFIYFFAEENSLKFFLLTLL
jgi:hypothetical protein